MRVDYTVAQSDAEENSRKESSKDEPEGDLLDASLRLSFPSPEVQQQLEFLHLQAQVRNFGMIIFGGGWVGGWTFILIFWSVSVRPSKRCCRLLSFCPTLSRSLR